MRGFGGAHHHQKEVVMAAKFAVDGDRYMQIDGRMIEIMRQLRVKGGSPLDPDLVAKALQRIAEGDFSGITAPGSSVPVAASRQRLRLLRGLYTPPERQLVNVRAWRSQRVKEWADVPDAWFTNLGPAPAWPDGKLQCVTLELALPDLPETKDAEGNTIPAVPGYIRTVRDLWDIVSHQHPKAWKLPELHLDAEHLFLLDGATYEPGLRWRVHDLGANWDTKDGIRPADVRSPLISPNVDGFATLAHHPQFVRRMDGVKVPYLWIAGFQVTVPGGDPRRCVPIALFLRGDRQVSLCVFWGDDRCPDCAVPVRLGGGGPRA
ncbi:hypothetical protein HY635_03330 [Candidatus Uhrbacteria bacterium]|nr:hypothetical protein [Candidatus Uhrbacteria bacterium]